VIGPSDGVTPWTRYNVSPNPDGQVPNSTYTTPTLAYQTSYMRL
jgi:hypothetical protein